MTISRKINLNLGRGKHGGKWVEGEVSGIFREISDNFRRSFSEFSDKFSEFPEIGPDLLKFSEITEILKPLKIQLVGT